MLGVSGGRVPAGTEALLEEAAVVAGGRAVLEALAPEGARQVVLGKDLGATLDALVAEPGPVVVLASGDPGFFGIVRALSARTRVIVHPAPSSVSLAFGRLGLSWDDALVVSAHGRDPRPAINTALRHPKVAILTEPGAAEGLVAQLDGRAIVAQALGTPEERVSTEPPFADPNVIVVHGEAAERATVWPPRTPTRWALPEAAFEHRAGMITKAEVRAVALSALGPGIGDLVWDVGCGSGSVAVECSRLGAAVIAIDHDAEAIGFTERNAAAHDAPVRTVHGAAPEALNDLPEPDAVFIGGGGAELPAIIDACAHARRAIVVTVALIERIAPTLERLASHGFEASATTLQASRVKPLAGGHRLAAENPVTVIAGTR